MGWLFLFFLSVKSGHIYAEENVYSFDTIQVMMPADTFNQDGKSTVRKSDFSVIRAVPMSSLEGARAVLVVFKNTNSGQRILDPRQIVAVTANGERHHPKILGHDGTFKGHEQAAITLEFGVHDYPIISVYTSESES